MPILLVLLPLVLAGFAAFQSTHPDSSFALGSRDTIVPFFVLTICLNIILSLAIMVRLHHIRRSTLSFAAPEHGTIYTSLSAIIVESSALTSVTGIITLGCYIRGNAVLSFVLTLYDQIVVSNLLASPSAIVQVLKLPVVSRTTTHCVPGSHRNCLDERKNSRRNESFGILECCESRSCNFFAIDFHVDHAVARFYDLRAVDSRWGLWCLRMIRK